MAISSIVLVAVGCCAGKDRGAAWAGGSEARPKSSHALCRRRSGVEFRVDDLGAPDRCVWGGYVGGRCGVTATGFTLLCRDVRRAYGVPRCAPRQTCLVGAACGLQITATSINVDANELEPLQRLVGKALISITIGRFWCVLLCLIQMNEGRKRGHFGLSSNLKLAATCTASNFVWESFVCPGTDELTGFDAPEQADQDSCQQDYRKSGR